MILESNHECAKSFLVLDTTKMCTIYHNISACAWYPLINTITTNTSFHQTNAYCIHVYIFGNTILINSHNIKLLKLFRHVLFVIFDINVQTISYPLELSPLSSHLLCFEFYEEVNINHEWVNNIKYIPTTRTYTSLPTIKR